jgi:beta-lactamase class A
MHRRHFLTTAGLASALLASGLSNARTKRSVIDEVLNKMRKRFPDVIDHPEKYRLQISASFLYSGAWVHEDFRLGEEFFAPASMVKLPIALMAIKRLQDLNLPLSTQLRVIEPPSCASQADEIAQFEPIEKTLQRIMIVSDNGAFNRLYEFVGGDRVPSMLRQFGFDPNDRIQARLGSCGPADNVKGRGFELADSDGKIIAQDRFAPSIEVAAPRDALSKLVGTAYLDWQDNKINEAKDFSFSNHYRLSDMHALSLAIAGVKPHPLWDSLTPAHQAFMRQTMSTLPRNAGYDEQTYPDGWGKFFMHGDQKGRFPANLKITNKIGQAYGFLTDSAWIQQGKKQAVLSATIYVNADGVLNDDQYDYDAIGFPFLAEFGRQFMDRI